ncbi:E3 ubiquitin-protein ligase TRIM35-like [Boleophthalmus pectinirostris]|uniref:E3 ubiquitin-protein ligase TRIM35-like n=1 Tax=Boleophthalmus pectinirostris TaxID=150288 RepID=UPI002430D77B|nr:E3 ubiquitin-protein ligase TRIM35-like [Boleophthalmus pectinirostris]
MSSRSEEELSCPICQEIYKRPVLLSCSHSVCELCLKSWWREKPTKECPVCKRRSSRSDPPQNLALRNQCEAYVQQGENKAPEKQEELSCPICQEIYKRPVLLSCSHSVCELCLKSWWREKPTKECPVCKRRSSRSDPPQNLALRNLCEAYVQQGENKAPEEHVCPLHSEKLRLFCLTDQQPACLVCRDSKVHEDHRFRPIVETAQELRQELDQSLLPLKEHLEKTKDVQNNLLAITERIKDQAQDAQKQICDEFKKMHQFLEEEEEARLKALREEEEQKIQKMKDKMEAVSREIEALSETIRATEEQLRAADVSFLLQYKAAVERVQRCPLLDEPQLGPGTLIDQAKHLGNLAFHIWSSMKTMVHYSPVVLDLNTVGNEIMLDDVTSWTLKKKNKNSELGVCSDGYSSGSHSWIVEVGDSDSWVTGVTTKNANDDGDGSDHGDSGEDVDDGWAISLSKGKYKTHNNDEDSVNLKLTPRPRRIRVLLDCDKHEVSFYDLDTDALLHSFTQISSEKLFSQSVIRTDSVLNQMKVVLEQIGQK